MKTITINVNERAETKFRNAAGLKFGRRKGSLGKAASAALEEWADKQMSGSEAKLIELLDRGFDLGGFAYKNRNELHER